MERDRITRRNEIVKFVELNGWKEDCSGYEYKLEIESEDNRTFYKENNIGIDILLDEVVLIGDSGDFAHIEINHWIIYTLIGFLLDRRYIAIDYCREKNK